MKRLIFLLLFATACQAQVPQAIKGTHGYGTPSGGAYDIGTHYIDDSTNPPTVYICSSLTLVGNQNTCVWTTIGSGGSMTWPTGSAGIPNYGGSNAWGTTYNALNTIPAAFISTLNQNTTGTAGGLTGCSTSTAGSICYWNGSAWTLLVGNTTQTNWLQETSSGVPSWTAPPGSGTVNSGTQFALGEYATAGTALSTGPTPPSTNGIYTLIYNVNAGAAVAPSVSQMVASGRSITGAATTDTAAAADFGTIVTHDQAATGAVTITLPTATSLGNPAFWYKYCNHSPQTDTLTPTTWAIQTGSAAAGASQTISSGVCLTVTPDKNNATQWHGDLTNAGGGGYTPGAAALDSTSIGQPAGNGNWTYLSGNGMTLSGTAPASASTNGTNATSPFTLNGVTGGATTGSATTAGAGDTKTITAGNGGSGSGGTNAIGGAGGSITDIAGNGGPSGGTAANANGGNISLIAGVPGTGGSGTAGNYGAVIVQGGAGNGNTKEFQVCNQSGSCANPNFYATDAGHIYAIGNVKSHYTGTPVTLGNGDVESGGEIATPGATGGMATWDSSTTHAMMAFDHNSTNAGIVSHTLGAVAQTAQTAAIATSTACASAAGACDQAGQYTVDYDFYGSGTACSAVTAGSVQLQLTWTDSGGTAHSAIALPVYDLKGGTFTNQFNFNTSLATEGASGHFNITTNGTVIQYATSYTACTTGTGTYNLHVSVSRKQ